MVLVVVLSVFGGFESLLKERVLSYTPHINLNRIAPWPDPEEYPDYNAEEEWRAVQEKMSRLPGVESSYALVNDFVLLDRNGAVAPASMQAIDTKNEKQLQSLAKLIPEGKGNADMGLGDQAVISSLTAEKFSILVGDTIQIHTNRNLEQLKPVLNRIGGPRFTESHAEAYQHTKQKLNEILKPSGAQETAPITEMMDFYYNRLTPILDLNIRNSEKEIISNLMNHLTLGERSTPKPDDSGIYTFPKGHLAAANNLLNSLKTVNLEKADIHDVKHMKTVVLPKDLKVIGIYRASRHTLSPDVFVPLPVGQDLAGLGDGVRGIALRLDDPYLAAQVLENTILPNMTGEDAWEARTWMQDHQQQFGLISMQRKLLGFALGFIMLVSAFSIMAVMFTVTIQKKREIGVMKALGATPFQLVRVFLYQGVFIGLIGGIIGLALGYVVVLQRQRILDTFSAWFGFNPFPNDFNGFDGLPAIIDRGEWLLVFCIAFALCIVATLVPALVVSRSDAAKSLRNM